MENVDHIAEPLRALAMPIDSVNEDVANVRVHDDRNIEAIRASLLRFGQRLPIVVQKKGMIVRAGNARLRAAKELGWQTIAALVIDEPDVTATAYAIADNRTAELARWDGTELVKILESLSKENDIDIADLGWSFGEMEEIDGGMNDADEEWKGMPEFEQEDQSTWTSLKVNFQCKEDMESFAKLVGQKITEKTRSIWYPEQEIDSVADECYADESNDEP